MNCARMHLKEIKYHVFQVRRAEGRKEKAMLSFGILMENSIWIRAVLFSLFSPYVYLAEQREGLHHLIVLCRKVKERCGDFSLRLGLQ